MITIDYSTQAKRDQELFLFWPTFRLICGSGGEEPSKLFFSLVFFIIPRVLESKATRQ